MNYNKRRFTKEEFLQLPIHPVTRNVPANTDFLLGEEVEVERDGHIRQEIAGSMARQKESLLSVLEEITKSNNEVLRDDSTYKGIIKVKYWSKLRDGNVSERGGHITIKSIIDTMRPDLFKEPEKTGLDLTNLIPQTDETITVDTTTV